MFIPLKLVILAFFKKISVIYLDLKINIVFHREIIKKVVQD